MGDNGGATDLELTVGRILPPPPLEEVVAERGQLRLNGLVDSWARSDMIAEGMTDPAHASTTNEAFERQVGQVETFADVTQTIE